MKRKISLFICATLVLTVLALLPHPPIIQNAYAQLEGETLVREKSFPESAFMNEPSETNITLTHTFYPNGTWKVNSTIKGETYTLIFPIPNFGKGTVTLYQNTTHVWYNFVGRIGRISYNINMYFDFYSRYDRVKIVISGELSKPLKLTVPIRALNNVFVEEERFWSGRLIEDNSTILDGVGFDWSDAKGVYWEFNNQTQTLTFYVGKTFNIDPSTVATSTSSTATHTPHQRLSFYAQGRHWVFYSDGTQVGWRSSVDGVTWSAFTVLIGGGLGRRFSGWFDGTYVHVVSVLESAPDRVWYRRGTPNADGTVTWTPEQYPVLPFEDEDGRNPVNYANVFVVAKSLIAGNIYRLGDYGYSVNWETTVNIGSYGAGYKFVFNPYLTTTAPVGTTLPAAIQLKGWEYAPTFTTPPKKLWVLDGRLRVRVQVRNPDAIVHAGNLYARLWVSTSSDFSTGNSVLAGWTYTAVSFSGTAGQVIDVDINLDLDNPVGDAFIVTGKYLYLELLWDVTTAAANARVQIEANYGYSYLDLSTRYLYYPFVSVDSNGIPWVGYSRHNGIHLEPYVTQGNLADGTFNFRNATHRKLSSETTNRWSVTSVPLTAGKMYVLYLRTLIIGAPYYLHGQLWDGAAWSAEEDIHTLLNFNIEGPAMFPAYYSAVAVGDDVHVVALERTSYDIEHLKRTYGATTPWSIYATVQASTTSSSAPVLSLDEATGNLYAFWAGSPTANHIYYKKFSTGTWDASPTDWITENETLTSNDRLSSFYKVYGNRIGLVYMTKTASPYNVKYAFLQIGGVAYEFLASQILNLHESLVRQISVSFTQSQLLSLYEFAKRQIAVLFSITDFQPLSSAVSRLVSFSRIVSDAMTLLASAIRNVALSKTVGDAINLLSGVSRSIIAQRFISDFLNLFSEAHKGGMAFEFSLNEFLNLLGVPTLTVGFSPTSFLVGVAGGLILGILFMAILIHSKQEEIET